MNNFERYGATWSEDTDELQVEMAAIRLNGKWKSKSGAPCGNGLSFHYERMRRILWPELDGDHNGQRWHTLCRDTILSNKISVLLGPASAGKSHEAAWIYLCEYFIFPEETCVLVSSTDIRGLKKRVWGEIISLWQRAVDRFDYLPGNMLDASMAITTDSLEDVGFGERKTRDMRKGIFGVPCMDSHNTFVGLKKYHGIKQKRMRLIADEAAMMGVSFLNSFANLNGNDDFQAIIIGNPNEMLDPLGKAAEPIDGWDDHLAPEKTSVWRTRFMNGTCVNLIGTDSPNFDFPEDQPTRFRYLISREKIAQTISAFRKDSYEYHTQVIGSMITGTLARRVLSRRLCEQNQAMESNVNWIGPNRIRVAGLDSAYGGDRCVLYRAEFGMAVGDKTLLLLHPPIIVPVSVKTADGEPEEQISKFVKKECDEFGIPPENFAHDSSGRGSLGTFLARVWSDKTNPVEFGGQPTDRPVSLDHFVYDTQNQTRRLKTEKEHYSKKVSALWFAVRYCIEAGQLRGLAEDTLEEGCMRAWNRVANDKLEIETKADCKIRTGRSPDLMDACSLVVEMARRRGFVISKLGSAEPVSKSNDWLHKLAAKQKAMLKSKELTSV